MEKEQMANQQALYNALLYFGLLTDLKLVEEEMRKNEPLPTDKSNGALKNFWNKNVLNENRRRAMTKLSEKKNKILNRLEEFKDKHEQSCEEKSREQLQKQIDEVFFGDNANIGKALFSLQFCLDNQIEYENRELIYAEISYLLFGDKNVMDNLFNDLKENYAELIKAPFDKAQKTILMCLGVTALISVALPAGVMLTALTVPALVNSALLGAAATVETVAIYSSILLGGALVGTEIARQIKGKEAKENIRKISSEDLSLLLAIKATLIQYAKKTMSGEDMKLALDDCLKQLNDLRSDAEYLLIVERLDAEKSKKKIEICNNFTNRLVNIVGL